MDTGVQYTAYSYPQEACELQHGNNAHQNHQTIMLDWKPTGSALYRHRMSVINEQPPASYVSNEMYNTDKLKEYSTKSFLTAGDYMSNALLIGVS